MEHDIFKLLYSKKHNVSITFIFTFYFLFELNTYSQIIYRKIILIDRI